MTATGCSTLCCHLKIILMPNIVLLLLAQRWHLQNLCFSLENLDQRKCSQQSQAGQGAAEGAPQNHKPRGLSSMKSIWALSIEGRKSKRGLKGDLRPGGACVPGAVNQGVLWGETQCPNTAILILLLATTLVQPLSWGQGWGRAPIQTTPRWDQLFSPSWCCFSCSDLAGGI